MDDPKHNWKITSDIRYFSLHVNSKSNKSREIKFIKIDHPFPIKSSLQKKIFNVPIFHKVRTSPAPFIIARGDRNLDDHYTFLDAIFKYNEEERD